MDVNATVEHCGGVVTDNTAKGLAAGAIGHPVLDAGMVVDVLPAAGQVNAVYFTVATLATKIHHQVDPLELTAKGQVEAVEGGIGGQARLHPTDVQGGLLLQLQTVVAQGGTGLQQEFSNAVGKAALAADTAGKVLDHAGRAGLAAQHQQALVDAECLRLVGADPNHVYGLAHPCTGSEFEKHALGEGGVVEGGKQGFIAPRGKPQVGADTPGLLFVSIGETHQRDALGQLAGRLQGTVIAIDEYQPRPVEIGQIDTCSGQFHVAGLGPGKALLQALQTGVFPVLGLAPGQGAGLPALPAGALPVL